MTEEQPNTQNYKKVIEIIAKDPVRGILSNWNVKEGELVEAGTVIATLTDGENKYNITLNRPGIAIKLYGKPGKCVQFCDVIAVIGVSETTEDRYETGELVELIAQLLKKQRNIKKQLEIENNPIQQEIVDLIDEQVKEKRKILLTMYKELKKKENSKYDDSQYNKFQLSRELMQDYCKYVPSLEIDQKATEKPKIFIEFYSKVEEGKETVHQDFLPYFYGRSTSTYPYVDDKLQREGEPICDQYRVLFSPFTTIVAIADGCNWGYAPANAAFLSAKTFTRYLHKHRDLFINTNRIAKLCLEGLVYAHNNIIATKRIEGKSIGTTTLLGGVILKVNLLPTRSPSSIFMPHSPRDIDSPSPTQTSPVSSPPSNSILQQIIQHGPTASTPPSSPTMSRVQPSVNSPRKLNNSSIGSPRLKRNESTLENTDIQESSSSVALSPLSVNVNGIGNITQDVPASPGTARKHTNDFVFIFASIGDCKAFIWNNKKRRVEELTPDSRKENFNDAADCGGRIGPYIDGGPDLRNLEVFMVPCYEGDILFVCTDGVHDNFDPQMNGLVPKDLKLPQYPTWNDIPHEEGNAVKSEWRTEKLQLLLKTTLGEFAPGCDIDLKLFSETLVKHCEAMNQPAQAFMLQNPGKRLPSDYQLFPGKMDHTTIVTIKVTELSTEQLSTFISHHKLTHGISGKINSKSNSCPPAIQTISEIHSFKKDHKTGEESVPKPIPLVPPIVSHENLEILLKQVPTTSAEPISEEPPPLPPSPKRSKSKMKGSLSPSPTTRKYMVSSDSAAAMGESSSKKLKPSNGGGGGNSLKSSKDGKTKKNLPSFPNYNNSNPTGRKSSPNVLGSGRSKKTGTVPVKTAGSTILSGGSKLAPNYHFNSLSEQNENRSKPKSKNDPNLFSSVRRVHSASPRHPVKNFHSANSKLISTHSKTLRNIRKTCRTISDEIEKLNEFYSNVITNCVPLSSPVFVELVGDINVNISNLYELSASDSELIELCCTLQSKATKFCNFKKKYFTPELNFSDEEIQVFLRSKQNKYRKEIVKSIKLLVGATKSPETQS